MIVFREISRGNCAIITFYVDYFLQGTVRYLLLGGGGGGSVIF